jgi:2-(1,2-epoxy-1,2-dihydrophenyl)acetyl-CoA isomerase
MATSDTDEVLWEVEPTGVAWLTLNRPQAGNALTADQRGVMLDILEDAGNDLDVRAIVLTASGDRHFCTGGDLRVAAQAGEPEKPKHPDAPARPAGSVMRGLERHLGAQRFIAALQDCPKPIIAAVNGTAAGLGAHVAFACDLIVAADTARFIEIFVRRGVIPDGGGPFLVTRLVGPQKAKELFFFGDDVPAEEALRIGLVNRVAPAARLRDEVRAWAERLAEGPTVAYGLTKRLVNSAMESGREAAFRAEAMALEVTMQSHDSSEGVNAFVERRSVEFTGW